ncbi:hypothetical protein KGQ72_01770 [Patescibacteria group bacterium]|nr:hypothetical protein [Patescibacteria group bacterium]
MSEYRDGGHRTEGVKMETDMKKIIGSVNELDQLVQRIERSKKLPATQAPTDAREGTGTEPTEIPNAPTET